MTRYPVDLIVEGRRCLVVGGGATAAAKAAALATCGAIVDVVAPVVGPEVRALAGVTWHERAYQRGEVAGYRLVVAAAGDPALHRAVYEDGEAAGVWVNSADDPDSCSFTLPAILRRGSLLVTVSTGGRSPAAASWLRDRLASEIGPEYEILIDLLSEERTALRRSGRSSEAVDWRKALDSDMLELIRSGQINQARELLRTCLSSS